MANGVKAPDAKLQTLTWNPGGWLGYLAPGTFVRALGFLSTAET